MLYNTLKKLKARGGLTADLTYKIDIFFALGKLTEAEYNDLLGIGAGDAATDSESVKADFM